jgi:hypothetical protein
MLKIINTFLRYHNNLVIPKKRKKIQKKNIYKNFNGHTYGYTNKFLCKDCFAKGWGFFSIGFSRINKEDVTNIKQEELKRLKNYEWDQLILESLRKS